MTKFGEPQGEASESVEDLSLDILSAFDETATISQNAQEFIKCIAQSDIKLSANDKAHVLDMSFHDANENFWEMCADAASAQHTFLEAVRTALEQ